MATCVIPVAMAFFILDHTRIGAVVGLAPTLTLIYGELDRVVGAIKSRFVGEIPLGAWLLVIWLATPPLIVDTGGVFRLPYAKLLAELIGW